MAKTDRCPICGVAVKAENLIRHLNDTHPRHPDMPAIRERLKEDGRVEVPRQAAPPLRLRRWHVAVVAGILVVGAGAVWAAPYFDPARTFTRDSCITSEVFHLHPFLRIDILGSSYPIPASIGISPGCVKPLHTHTASDPTTGFVQLHLEGPVAKDFTLGDFFYVWKQPFSSTQILTHADDGTNHVRVRVDGSPDSTYGALVLRDGQQIEILYGPTS